MKRGKFDGIIKFYTQRKIDDMVQKRWIWIVKECQTWLGLKQPLMAKVVDMFYVL